MTDEELAGQLLAFRAVLGALVAQHPVLRGPIVELAEGAELLPWSFDGDPAAITAEALDLLISVADNTNVDRDHLLPPEQE